MLDDQKTTKQNLKLALSWNRRDIADDILMAHQDIKHVHEDDDEPGYDNLFDEIFTCKDIWEFFLTALTEVSFEVASYLIWTEIL